VSPSSQSMRQAALERSLAALQLCGCIAVVSEHAPGIAAAGQLGAVATIPRLRDRHALASPSGRDKFHRLCTKLTRYRALHSRWRQVREVIN
jgi:hypothetical protein